METNKTIAKDSELADRARALLSAAYDYWQTYQKECARGAVVWLEGDDGHFVLFTRSEYKESIMASVYREGLRNEPAMFDPFTVEDVDERKAEVRIIPQER